MDLSYLTQLLHPFSMKRAEPEESSALRKTIIFVRHGQSEYNKAMRETGRDPMIRDAPLTTMGRSQADAARSVLASCRSRMEAQAGDDRWLLLSSPLRRALDTAHGVWPEAFAPGATVGRPARLEIWPELREVVTGCDDLGTGARALASQYPHLAPHLAELPEVWWTVPDEFRRLPSEGDAMRAAYIEDEAAFEGADEALLGERLEAVITRLGQVPEKLIVIVAHCDLIGKLTRRLGLAEGGRKGFWLKNCECRVVENVEVRCHDDDADSSSSSSSFER